MCAKIADIWALLVGLKTWSHWSHRSKILTNETEYTCVLFRPETVIPSYSLTNETEYMRELFRPGTISPSYSLTNKTEPYL